MRYGVTGESVHRWMDGPVKLVGPRHRKYRHVPDQEIPAFLVEEYGRDLARNIMLDHLMFDDESTIIKRNNKKRTTSRKPKQTSINENILINTVEKLKEENISLKNNINSKLDELAQDLKNHSNQNRPDPLKEAHMFQHYLAKPPEGPGFTQEQVVEKLGLSSRQYLTDRLALLKLSPLVQDLVANLKGMIAARVKEKATEATEEELKELTDDIVARATITMMHLRPISTLPENDQGLLVSALIDTFVEGGTVSTRQVAQMVKEVKTRNASLETFNAAWKAAATKNCPLCGRPPVLSGWDQAHRASNTFACAGGHSWRYDVTLE